MSERIPEHKGEAQEMQSLFSNEAIVRHYQESLLQQTQTYMALLGAPHEFPLRRYG